MEIIVYYVDEPRTQLQVFLENERQGGEAGKGLGGA